MTPHASQAGLYCKCDPSYKRHLFWKSPVWHEPHLKYPNEELARHFLSWKFTPIVFLVNITDEICPTPQTSILKTCFKAEP